MNARLLTLLLLTLSAGACVQDRDTSGKEPVDQDVAMAERFVDAFYSFDRDRLAALLSSAGESQLRILEYQAWADGGRYEIIDRMPCEAVDAGAVRCSITVRDDLVAALGLAWWVTDHFDLSIENGQIVSIETSSNDPQVYHDARAWVQEHRTDLIEGPCEKSPETGIGLTPGLCAAAMAEGYREYAESDDFPEALPAAPRSQ